jgi:DNA-binding NarL/FixJ family response regulator
MAAQPIRIMAVDDQSDVRFLIDVILSDHADLALVAAAAGAEEALEQLDEAAPDVAVVDARMPRIDGYELTGRLLERRPDLRIVLLTSIVDEVIEEQARGAGAHAVASKADFDALPDVIRSLV